MSSALPRARAGWGGQPPRWIVALATACDAGSQASVSRRLRVSPATVSLLLSNRYPGDVAAMQSRIEKGLAAEVQAAAAPGWGTAPPDWIAALGRACEEMSQVKAARRIGYSPAVVSQVLRNTYKGDMARVEALVRGNIMGAEVDCPIFGPIPIESCVRNQERVGDPKAPRHALSRALSERCPECVHRLK